MFTKILTIGWNYLKTTFQSKTVLLMGFAMPLVFTFVLGQVMADNSGTQPPTSYALAVVQEEPLTSAKTSPAKMLVDTLDQNPVVDVQKMEAAAALAALEEETVVAVLAIPAGFDTALLEGTPMELTLQVSPSNLPNAQILEQALSLAVTQLDGSLRAARISTTVAEKVDLFGGSAGVTSAEYYQDALVSASEQWETGPRAVVSTQPVTHREDPEKAIPNGFGQSAPGMLVMYAMFFMLGGGTLLVAERLQGTLRRLIVMPMHKGAIILGKFTGIYLSGILQMGIMIAAGALLFKVEWGNDLGALVILVLVYGFTITSLGLLLGALARSTSQAGSLSTLGVMAMSALGGAWWPLEIVPAWMQKLALVFPTGWAMRGFNDLITRGLTLSAILPELAALAGFAVLFLAIGVWRFKYE